MEGNEKKFWLPVAAVWLICIAVTALTLWKSREPETEIHEPLSVAGNGSPETEKVSLKDNIMIIGTAEPSFQKETAETIGSSKESLSMGTVRASAVETTVETIEKKVFEPETHVIPLPVKQTAQSTETVIVKEPEETETPGEPEAVMEMTQPETAVETGKTEGIRTEAPVGIPYREESEALDPGPASISMVPYEYRCSETAGIIRRENYEDRFYVSFHRTASGETMSFDYITYDTRWISALEKRYPEEDTEHATSVKARFSARGSVYSYRVSAFRDGVSWINILPDDRIVIVEEGGKDGIRYYAAEGYNREILPDM